MSRKEVVAVSALSLLFAGVTCGVTIRAQAALTSAPATPATVTQPTSKQAVVAKPSKTPKVVRLGVQTPGVSRSISEIRKTAEFPVAGSPDWSVMTKDAVWVTSGGRTNHVVQLSPATNQAGLSVDVPLPCSGLANGFGSVWAPSCGQHSVLRIDPSNGKVIATIPADPANSEGGITAGAGAVWIVTKPAALVRIDPQTNTVTAKYELPLGSENPLFSDGFLWVSSFEEGKLIKLDPRSGKVLASLPVGPKPRFLTAGAGSIWTLNQGDGSISRIDEKSGRLLATIACGIQGGGGGITVGNGHVLASMFDFPLTEIDPASNKVVKQWGGPGGDGIRFGFGSVWLSNGAMGTVWRLPPDQP